MLARDLIKITQSRKERKVYFFLCDSVTLREEIIIS